MTRRALWTLPPLLLVAGFFVYPLTLTALQSGGAWTRVATSPEFGRTVLRTLEIAVCATIGCLLLGTFFALVLTYAPFPGARAVARLIDTVLAFPSYLIALAFTVLYGSAGVVDGLGIATLDFIYTPAGLVFAEITFYTPFVMRPLLAAFGQVPPAQLEVAASLGARPWRVVRQVLLPEALPALAAGGGLTLLLTLNEFGLVLFIGAKDVTTLPMLVYTKGLVTFDQAGAAVAAVAQVALSLTVYSLYRRVAR
ncbi:2-aminoethylphosphonate ABC transporter permease subunit [Actinomadura macrotermitis]|uniref:Putative 2-aminoethylphosphonate transport system permease protein PhnU n=1 Tax=Actinomadura macrotermitis TaxID=2585200 RepID=A0A7K0BYP2_9ACTN|nr:putative 2-aminoethylphosphonate transport system permease protein PhnU [Actinomadura macrotermitis]